MRLICLNFLILFFVYRASADVCLSAKDIHSLQKDYPNVVVGRVTDKRKSTDSRGNTRLVIEVQRILQGSCNKKQITAFLNEKWKDDSMPTYKIGRLYAFPIEYYPKRKPGEQYELLAMNQSCELYQIDESPPVEK